MNIVRKPFLFIIIFFCASLLVFKSSYANPTERLNIDAEVEYKVSDFERDPEPALSSTGSNLAQDYRFYLEGSILKEGLLDSLFGVSLGDKYRKDDTDFENKLRFDYGRWLTIDTLSHHETDEEIFFSGTTEPQSPIHTIIKKYETRLALDPATSLYYSFEDNERKDVLLGTTTGEKTRSETVRLKRENGPLNFNSEYREVNFDDLLGTRSDVRSRDLNLDMSYRPMDSFSISGFLENKKDIDIINNTALDSDEYRLEFALKPLKELKLRNRLKLSQDNDTKTGEDLSNKSDEIIINLDPVKQLGVEFAYKREDEDKERVSSEIDSAINEERLRLRITPFSCVNIQSGYEVSDKTSTSSTENIKNTKLYSDISLTPINNLRLGVNFSNAKQKNTFTSTVESDTNLISASTQYRVNEKASLFVQIDTSKTDNPSTGAFTKTDTLSSRISVDPFSFLNMSLRNSAQETSGTSTSALSERLLNALELDIKLLDNLKVSTEYELVMSSGTTSSDENLFDIATFYNIGKFDFSLRFQDRGVTGDNPTDKTAVLSNIKYRLSPNAVFSFRFSLINYTDKLTAANSYDSTTIESLLSMRF
ncbi:MAG: hypothetical protein Q8L26_07670 [Candidatus Omnitrophota bacterium]|nr:hypothetical protein [Candidatus Omnitrophota bacterium]